MKFARLTLALLLPLSFNAQAELIQILHTNDLHSHLEHAPHRPEVGGYARMKVLIDKHRALAANQGIPTIAMDGGDTMEGNLYYMADKGKKTLEAFNQIGYDVSVLGNHDYLMGPDDLEAIMKEVPPRFALLAANFKLSSKYPHINQNIKPVYETIVNGVKVGVIGITLNDMLYKWRLNGEGKIKGEHNAAKYWAKYLRSRGNEVIIALTHIGVNKDKKLAKAVPELDLIVGGHSHDALFEIVYQKSGSKNIPIVQAGKYGEWLGKLTLDYNKETRKLTVKSYGLISAESDEQDAEMLALIEEANEDLYDLYGKEWLEGVVGRSFLRPVHVVDDSKIWHFFVNDSMLESAQSDFAVHASALSGENYPLGDVTRRDLYNGNPRTFDYADKHGYSVYTAYVNGFLIKLIAKAVMNLNAPLYFSGIDFKWEKKSDGNYRVWDLKHKGQKIKYFKRYKVAFSEAIVRGGYGISPWIHLVLHYGDRTGVSMWKAMEEKFQREGDLHPDYLDRYYRQSLLAGGVGMERVMVPVNVE
jgi:5'-nucleotidase/UDP-sugar diphosphatase